MITPARRRANRINAARSTGPRTQRGKARSAQNALQHGLAVPVAALAELSYMAETIARIVAGPRPDPGRLERARQLAEAQVDLRRVRAVKLQLLTRLQEACGSSKKALELTPSSVMRDLLDGLPRLDRYERRILSRRKFAARLI